MPGALQDILQETGNMHSVLIGFSRDQLPGATSWVLVKTFLHLERPVKRQEEITVTTWYRGNSGVQVYRDYDIHAGGEWVGEAVTAWVLFDLEQQRLLRPDIINDPSLIYTPQEPKTLILNKITPPKTVQSAGTRPARYSDLDMNGHMNNVKYLDIVTDTLRLEEKPDCFLRSVNIQYSSQTLPGQILSLETGKYPDGRIYVSGKDGAGERKFSALAELSIIP